MESEPPQPQIANYGRGTGKNSWDTARQSPAHLIHLHRIQTKCEALNMVASDTEPLIRDGDAARILCCSKATFWRRVADGTIPRPVKIGGMSRWPRSEILDVIELAKIERS